MSEPRTPYLDAPFIVTLPWMDYAALRPNFSNKQSEFVSIVRRKAAAEARRAAYITALHHRNQGEALPMGKLHLLVEFHPPDGIHRDLDGLHSAIKPYLDGIFDAFGRDDNDIRRTWLEICDKEKPGRVVVELRRK